MARKPETMTLPGALEVQAQKPLDGRRKVTLIADLTEAASFPYIYKGLDVFCEENEKWYTFLGGDQTDINNWRMEGSGGGGGASLDITENYARVSQDSKQIDVWGKSADSLTIEYTDNNGNTGGGTLYTSRSTYRKDEVDHMVEQRPLYQNSISGGKLTSMIIANENEKGINVAQSENGVNVSFYGNSTDTKNLVDKAYVDGGLADKADKATTYTKAETDAALADKQDTLESGVSIKTVNGNSLLGSGNLEIGGGSGTVDTAMSDTSENAVQNKVIKAYVDNVQGLPSGGTNGQILAKNTMSPDNSEWIDNPVGDIEALTTTDKTDAVSAINELNSGKANFDIGTVPLGGAGVYEVNAILNNNDSERVRATYSRGVNGELPDWFSMSVTSGLGTDNFEVSTRGYTEQKAAQAQNNAQTYADLKLTQKQDKLVSGTNIKTINGQTVVGSGDLILHQGVGDGLDLNDMPSYNQLEQMINNNALLYIDGNWLVTGLELESTTAQVIGEYADKVRRYHFDTEYDLDAPLIYGGTYTEYYSMNPNMVVNADISQPYGEFTTGDGETFRFWGLDKRIGIDFKDKRGRQQRRNYDFGVNFEVGAEKWYGTYTENGVTYQVYSKLLELGPLPSAAGTTQYPHGISGIKQILQINGFTNDGFVMNAPRQNAQDNISIYQAQKSGNIAVEVGKDRSGKNGFVMLIYAKNN